MIHKQQCLGEIYLATLSQTRILASRIAPLLTVGDIIALDGPLGVGKTEFCRSIIKTLMPVDDIPSPTFNLVQIYTHPPGKHNLPEIWHMDLYRLDQPRDAFELGIEEAFDEAISLIEWPSRLEPYLPADTLVLKLVTDKTSERRLLTFFGNKRWQQTLEKIIP